MPISANTAAALFKMLRCLTSKSAALVLAIATNSPNILQISHESEGKVLEHRTRKWNRFRENPILYEEME